MTTNPPLKCEKCKNGCSGFESFSCACSCHRPTAEPKCCEKCRAEDITLRGQCDHHNCPCHTPPVEGEWKMELKKIWRHYGTLLELESFITTLLHSERGKGEKAKDELEVLLSAEREEARAEERARIVKMCEEMRNNLGAMSKTANDAIQQTKGYDQALSDLRDKLSNK